MKRPRTLAIRVAELEYQVDLLKAQVGKIVIERVVAEVREERLIQHIAGCPGPMRPHKTPGTVYCEVCHP